MIHPKRDFLLALTLLGLSLCAIASAALGPGVFDDSKPRGVALVFGGFGALFGLIFTVNFAYSLRLAANLSQGKGVIASWVIQPDQMRAFIAADAAINGPKNLWRPKADTVARPVTITFGPELVIADGAMLTIPSAGTQSIRAVILRPQMLEFATQLTTARGGSVGGFVTYKTPLRLPAPDPVLAESLRRYYQDILDGRTIVAPHRWTARIKIGLWAMAIGPVMAGAGYLLAESINWRGGGTTELVAMVLLILGLLLVPAGLVITLVAWQMYRIQHRRP